MATAQAHIIDKVVVEVNCNSMERALFLKDRIDEVLQQQVFPKLEAWLENQGLYSENLYRLDALDLDLNTSSSAIDSDLAVKLCEKIQEKISQTIQKKNTSEKSVDVKPLGEKERHPEAFLHFLKTGSLPWYFNEGEKLNLNEVTAALKLMAPDLKKLLSENSNARKRLVFQFAEDSEFLKNLLPVLLNDNSKSISAFENRYSQNTDSAYRESLFNLVLECFTGAPKSRVDQALNQLLYTLLPHKESVRFADLMAWSQLTENQIILFIKNNKAKLLVNDANQLKNNSLIFIITPNQILNKDLQKLPVSEQTPVFKSSENLVIPKIFSAQNKEQDQLLEADTGSSIVQQAGLVLLHPFLPVLFNELNFLSETKQLQESKRDEAVHLLHFLATGNLKPYEAELGFEKYLCGLPQQFPVRRDVKLSRKQKAEATHLLETAIKHWSALKNTSPAGLRGQFLVRPGKLSFENERDQLQLERVTADILLDQLPWGLSMMRLPWLKKILYINW
ncbi:MULTISPECIES: contractile injection system tape measure protein [unclassified Leeuwenhoekiella]|uniref:contractile injection system tape measure protein n=1 Tax=unclassified Leeuwenhoekiella TaxID=2615029 RepID=UPI000C4E1459|nr:MULTISPECIES: contractile injection system tape measure protein [unclassified Leeuwenhoekiella]MAW95178.1 hypothetical protein [Leeuwenhoekiella sp.]MBA81899.1 hypothetical protein [Leeuwenhoekiella sp.]|tara:strand:- start:24617 stop:26134 length:1518 start_codon:yes stop_codon:yes gene_type:complete